MVICDETAKNPERYILLKKYVSKDMLRACSDYNAAAIQYILRRVNILFKVTIANVFTTTPNNVAPCHHLLILP